MQFYLGRWRGQPVLCIRGVEFIGTSVVVDGAVVVRGRNSAADIGDIGWASGGDFVIAVTVRSWEALAFLIVFGSLVAFSAYNRLLERYSPTLVATHTYANPVVAVLLGWLLAGEKVTLNVGIAAAMVIGAVVLVDQGTAPSTQKR